MPENCSASVRKSSSGSSSMHCVRRISVTEEFEMKDQEPIPEVPKGGARVRVRWICNTISILINEIL